MVKLLLVVILFLVGFLFGRRSTWIIECNFHSPVKHLKVGKHGSRGIAELHGVDLSIWDLVALTSCEQGHLFSGAAMVIQTDAYLRPSEVFAIARDHLVPPSASRTRGIWGVTIGLLEGGMPTKAGDFDDVVLFNTKSRSDVNTVVASLARRSTSKSLCIFHPVTVEQYGKHIKAACDSLGLSNLYLTPHYLKHSGISHDAYYVLRDFTSI